MYSLFLILYGRISLALSFLLYHRNARDTTKEKTELPQETPSFNFVYLFRVFVFNELINTFCACFSCSHSKDYSRCACNGVAACINALF